LKKKSVESETVFKFLDAQLLVRSLRPNSAILLAHNSTLSKGSLARYILTRVEVKTFTFSTGLKFSSIVNTVLDPIPKPPLFTIDKNADFIGSLESNPSSSQHYDMSDFSLFVKGKQLSNKVLSLGMDREKIYVMGYRSLLESSGIHNSKSRLQITHDIYI